MQNRDFLRKGEGYDYCLRKIGSLPPTTWLINQHVAPMFRYTAAQMQRMSAELDERSAALRQLSPWPDPLTSWWMKLGWHVSVRAGGKRAMW